MAFVRQQKVPIICQQHRYSGQNTGGGGGGGGEKSAQSEQPYTVLQDVTLPVCLCHRKNAPINPTETLSPSASKF